MDKQLQKQILPAAGAALGGAALGAYTKNVGSPHVVRGLSGITLQAGQALGATLAGGAGIGAALGAGGTAATAAVTATAVAAAPVVLTLAAVGAGIFAAVKVYDWLSE